MPEPPELPELGYSAWLKELPELRSQVAGLPLTMDIPVGVDMDQLDTQINFGASTSNQSKSIKQSPI